MTSPALSVRLREATTPAHRAAEESPWARALAAGTVGGPAYAAYLVSLQPVYAALERALATHAGDPSVAAVHHPGLARTSALAADVGHWGTTSPPQRAREASEAYAERIRSAAAADPALLVAHHYVRYLGDLSGGQVVAGPTTRGGTSTVPFVRGYRDRLDALALGEERTEAVVAEAVASFAATTAVFTALQPLLVTGG